VRIILYDDIIIAHNAVRIYYISSHCFYIFYFCPILHSHGRRRRLVVAIRISDLLRFRITGRGSPGKMSTAADVVDDPTR